jgi:hypothetical protein
MKKQMMMGLMAASVVIFSGVSIIQADVLYFDDITTGNIDVIVPNGYGGFSWVDSSNKAFYVTDDLPQFAISGNYCIYTQSSEIARPDERLFNFNGAWMATTSPADLSVWVQGFNQEGHVIFSENIILSNTTSQWYDFNFTGIFKLGISASNYVILDNFTYSLVPVEFPRGEVVVDFDDRFMGGSEFRTIPLGFKGILWDESVWVCSEYNYEFKFPGLKYAIPHSWG